MSMDYNLLLDSIKRRRYDETTDDHVISASFYDEELPKPIRYTLESMQEVDLAFARQVYANAQKISQVIGKELDSKGIEHVVRYQGALRSRIEICLFGEMDMLFILSDKVTHKDVQGLGQLIRGNVVNQDLQSSDYSDGVHIKLVTQKPVCKINIIPCSWMNNPQTEENRKEIYRGVAVYNFKDRTRKKFLPFLNMARIDAKDIATKGNYKKLIRLWRSICSDNSIALNGYEVECLAYGIEDENFEVSENKYLAFLPNMVNYLKKLLKDGGTLETMLSPSKKELVFGKNLQKEVAVRELLDFFQGLVNDLMEFIGDNLDAPIEYSTKITGSTKPK